MAGGAAIRAIEAKRATFEQLAMDLWEHPEVAFQERYACQKVSQVADNLGFQTEQGIYGLPTAMRATWGHGFPVIGFLGEYDALPALSQHVSTEKSAICANGPGHGCGHNLLGTALLAAAYGLKEALREKGLPGTVVYYGCPAEENCLGKGLMAREGAFRELDLAFSWHGDTDNSVGGGKNVAVQNEKFLFHGRSAHAGGAPHLGRSALDAVELMDVGANYLREHVTPDVRIHYVITDGGKAPNIVPEEASVWYCVRAVSRDAVEDVLERLRKIAQGAALMTETTVSETFLSGCYDTMPNQILVDLLYQSLCDVQPPEYTKEELEFADELNRKNPNYDPKVHQAPLHTGVMPIRRELRTESTDVADVMHICPCASICTTTVNWADAGHSWQTTACSGHSIGLKGMLYGARALALAACRAAENHDLVLKAKAEFEKNMGGETYHCPIPADFKVAWTE